MNNNVILLISPSFKLISIKIEELKKELGYEDAMVTTYDMEEQTINQVLEDANTLSFLTPQKVIIAKNCSFLEDGSSLTKDEEKDLLDYIEHPSDDVLLIFIVKKLDNRKKIGKTLKSKINFLPLEVNEEEQIKKLLSSYKLERGVVKLLVEYCNHDIEKIFNECEKLKLYKIDTKDITIEDVKELVTRELPDQDNLVFSLVSSIAERNKRHALMCYQDLLEYKIEAFSIMGLLESQYRLLYQVKSLTNQHLSNEEIGKMLGVHPYRVLKTRELLGYYSLKQIGEMLKYLADLDYKVKSGKISQDILIELIIFNQ